MQIYGDSAIQLSTITPAFLNSAFEAALKMHSKRTIPKLKFILSKGIKQENAHMYNPLDFGTVFSIDYEIEFPLNLIINEECIEKYNKIFCFIITVKYFFTLLL